MSEKLLLVFPDFDKLWKLRIFDFTYGYVCCSFSAMLAAFLNRSKVLIRSGMKLTQNLVDSDLLQFCILPATGWRKILDFTVLRCSYPFSADNWYLSWGQKCFRVYELNFSEICQISFCYTLYPCCYSNSLGRSSTWWTCFLIIRVLQAGKHDFALRYYWMDQVSSYSNSFHLQVVAFDLCKEETPSKKANFVCNRPIHLLWRRKRSTFDSRRVEV